MPISSDEGFDAVKYRISKLVSVQGNMMVLSREVRDSGLDSL